MGASHEKASGKARSTGKPEARRDPAVRSHEGRGRPYPRQGEGAAHEFVGIPPPGCGTLVCAKADSETAANALRNSREVAKRHYIKPETVLPKTRKAVNATHSLA